MKKILFLLLACLLLAASCEAREQYWRNPHSPALHYGARGVIIPSAGGDQSIDNMLLSYANSKAPFISWSLASGLNSSMTPQAISAALPPGTELFLVASRKDMPLIHEHFDSQDISYRDHEWEDTMVDITDHEGRTKERYVMHGYDRVWQQTERFDAKDITVCHSYTSFNLYDATGTELLCSSISAHQDSYQLAEEACAQSFFGKGLPAAINNEYGKLDRQKVKSTEWADPACSIKGKTKISVALPEVTDPAVADLPNYPLMFQAQTVLELQDKKIFNVTTGDSGQLKVEVSVQQYNIRPYRIEPQVKTSERSETDTSYRRHHNDKYSDTYSRTRYWTEVRRVEGDIDYDCSLSVTVRVVDTATGRMAYSYNATAPNTYKLFEAYASAMHDFAKKLKKKVD